MLAAKAEEDRSLFDADSLYRQLSTVLPQFGDTRRVAKDMTFLGNLYQVRGSGNRMCLDNAALAWT